MEPEDKNELEFYKDTAEKRALMIQSYRKKIAQLEKDLAKCRGDLANSDYQSLMKENERLKKKLQILMDKITTNHSSNTEDSNPLPKPNSNIKKETEYPHPDKAFENRKPALEFCIQKLSVSNAPAPLGCGACGGKKKKNNRH